MSYRLQFDQTLDDGLRRVASEQLGDALTGLRDPDGTDPVKAVHEARKSVKKSRAALRLARPALPKDAYRREDQALRDAGRSLSGARDADVLLETVDALGERFAGQLPEAAFADLRARMAVQLADVREGGDDTAAAAALTRERRDAGGAVAARRGRLGHRARRRRARLCNGRVKRWPRPSASLTTSACTTCASASRTSGTTSACCPTRGPG